MSPAPQRHAPTGEWDNLDAQQLQDKLKSSPDGLSQSEALRRLMQYGNNEIAEKQTNQFLKFLTYFWGPIPWMIEAAVVLSAVAQHWPDFTIILLLLLANAVIGFWEEHQAGNAIAALKAKLAMKAQVKRDGQWTTVESRELVPGDVVHVRLGDIVPADARLLDGDPLQVDQSALTGESLPVKRQSGEAIMSGSIIRRGEIDAMVYATGANTFFGKTAELVQAAQSVSHFQQAVLKIGNYLILLAAGFGVSDPDRCAAPRRPTAHHPSVRPGVDRCCDSRGHAHGALCDHGGGSAPADEERGDRDAVGGH